jgi:hypothetical protein
MHQSVIEANKVHLRFTVLIVVCVLGMSYLRTRAGFGYGKTKKLAPTIDS